MQSLAHAPEMIAPYRGFAAGDGEKRLVDDFMAHFQAGIIPLCRRYNDGSNLYCLRVMFI
jgi:hypothetical protein